MSFERPAMETPIRILIAMPHFFDHTGNDRTNRSRQASAYKERLEALIAAICGPHQALGTETYGLDHGEAKARRMIPKRPYTIDLVVCTTRNAHLLDELQPLDRLYHHYPTDAEPIMLGF